MKTASIQLSESEFSKLQKFPGDWADNLRSALQWFLENEGPRNWQQDAGRFLRRCIGGKMRPVQFLVPTLLGNAFSNDQQIEAAIVTFLLHKEPPRDGRVGDVFANIGYIPEKQPNSPGLSPFGPQPGQQRQAGGKMERRRSVAGETAEMLFGGAA